MSRISKLVKAAQSASGVIFTQGKMFVPVDMQQPTTQKEAIARTLLQSGVINRDDYEKMLGVAFDTRDDSEENWNFEDEEDEFRMSSFAEYEEDLEENESISQEENKEVAADNNLEPRGGLANAVSAASASDIGGGTPPSGGIEGGV